MIHRYENDAIRDLWTPTAIYRRWFEIEVQFVRHIEGLGVAEALEEIGPPTQREVAYYERQTGHDVAGFLRAVDAKIQRSPNPHQAHIRASLHYGLTSSDVVDTGLALGLQDSHHVVREVWETLIRVMLRFDKSLIGQQTIGRTHGQLAAPMPANHRWTVLSQMLSRTWTRVAQAFVALEVGKLSGPVGIRTEGEAQALERLGLHRTGCTQIVPRDRLAHWAHCMAELATVCEAIATQVWLLAQAGVDELKVAPAGEVGSSAMPHKTNPILAENVRGLARLARALADTLQLGVVQWGEHDLAHSSVERVSVPDLLHLVCTAMNRTIALVSGLSWTQPEVPTDYRDTGAILRLMQAEGMPYVDAHAQLTATYRDGKIPGTHTEED